MLAEVKSNQKSLADQLKNATGAAHQYAETRPLQKLFVKGELPLEALKAYFAQLCLVHRALEQAIDARQGAAAALGWPGTMRHSDRLAEDLGALGIDTDTLLPNTATAALTERLASMDDAATIGAFYVLEGSMNGNRFIARAVAHAYPQATGLRFAYLDPYGEAQRELWLEMRGRIDAFGEGLTAEQRADVVDAALAMFDAVAAISDEVAEASEAVAAS